ncbi:hypothetical protein [Tahibacter harae]|uniref:Uncharacterized protein n=1 Tax=Tahibacter harae TaxID=2963937 RepID=A0ABT1QWE4_9GAMM|nr:hypothetical protein [Tahibacter harae]MCQ4166603.1 hypothetical protein [Tahibacter harae]
MPESAAARRRVQGHCQALVEAGTAHWHINADGATELHLHSGEAYLFGPQGVTRLK